MNLSIQTCWVLLYRRARLYLQVRHGDSVNLVLLGLVDFVEQVIECQHHDTMILVRPKHCVGLASTCGGERGREGGREERKERRVRGREEEGRDFAYYQKCTNCKSRRQVIGRSRW